MRRRRIAKLSVMMVGSRWQLRLLTAAYGTKRQFAALHQFGRNWR
jgi:hypothetical protein